MEMAQIALKLATKTGQILLQLLVPKLGARNSRELSLWQTVHKEVKSIIDELEAMSAFLREAEEKQVSNKVDRDWVKKVRKWSHKVEDCIDEFSLHLGQRTDKNLEACRDIADQIQSIKDSVKEVSERRKRYKIDDMSKSQGSDKYNVAQYNPQLTALFVEDGQLVGIDGPREKLVGWLMDEAESELRLIAVVGGGGLGKTTIVKKAYDRVTSTHFTCRAWITVSRAYHVEGILRHMIKQISPSPPGDLHNMPRHDLIDTLKRCLQDERYVIVFDDLWTMDAWNSLEIALPKNNRGSRVILTTRNKKVAEACRSDISGQTYELEKLDDQSSRDLFCRRTFKNTDGTCPKEVEEASQDLVKICGGLPLAIVSIASVLASKQLEKWKETIEEWKKLPGCLGSELKLNPNPKGADRILTLSYNDLDYNVKLCFLYLSRYPKDHLMLRKDVQRLWIAEGFVEYDQYRAADVVAESYFSELVNRFLILPSEFSVDGKVKTFRLHDVMFELLVSKSTDENFVTILGKNGRCQSDDVIRRLSFHPECNPEDVNLSHVRSLSMFWKGIRPVSPSLRMLRVLDLYGSSGGDGDVLEKVGKLLHLKCLMLRRTGVRKLPKSLGKLRNLETLDLRGSDVDEMPSKVTELQQLRVLHGRRSGSMFPRGMGNLRSLQELTGVDLKESEHGAIEEIGKLTKLRKLGVSRLPRKWEDDFCKSLGAMKDSLRSLKVLGRRRLSRDDEPFLNNLSAPPLQLRSLHLGSYPKRKPSRVVGLARSAVKISVANLPQDDELTPFLNNLSAPPPPRNWKLPSWVGSLDNAVKITLEDFPLDDRAVEALGNLPKLMMLNVCTGDKVHNLSFGAAEGFRSLKRLSLEFWFEVSLSFREGAMPHLESFDLRYFTWTSPKSVGLNNLPRLKEIKVTASSDFLGALEAEIDGHPNHPRVMPP